MPKTICYTSHYTNAISAFNLELLFHKIRLNNDKHNIKGVLVSKNEKFFQILEGDSTIVDELYLSIKKDTRHHKINEVLNTTSESYAFKDFGTGYNTIKSLESLIGLQMYITSLSKSNLDNANLYITTIKNFFK